MGKVIKYNFRLLLHSKMFMIQFPILIGLCIAILLPALKEIITDISASSLPLSIQNNQIKLQFQGASFLMILSFLIYVFYTTLQETLQKEKLSRRTEFLLANGIQLRDIWIGTAFSNFIVNCIITIIIESEVLIIAKAVNINPFSMFNVPYLALWVVGFPLIALSLSFLLVTIELIVRRVEFVQGILFSSFFLVNFGGTYLVKHLLEKITPNSSMDLFTWNTVGIFIVIGAMILIIAFLIARKINVEDITLSMSD